MTESYQAIYDAVRSRVYGGNVYDAVYNAAREMLDVSHARMILQEQIGLVGAESVRPSVLMKPAVFADGDMWCALYGDDIQSGVCGFGKTPDEASRAFDAAWHNESPPKPKRACSRCGDVYGDRDEAEGCEDHHCPMREPRP